MFIKQWRRSFIPAIFFSAIDGLPSQEGRFIELGRVTRAIDGPQPSLLTDNPLASLPAVISSMSFSCAGPLPAKVRAVCALVFTNVNARAPSFGDHDRTMTPARIALPQVDTDDLPSRLRTTELLSPAWK